MAQQLINVGTVANDRSGDSWRDAFIKVNANETELFEAVAAIGLNFIGQEADFATQDATTITLESSNVYVITASFSTAKRFVCESGSNITAFTILGIALTYTGVSAMFSGTDVSFTLNDITINAPNGVLFGFSDVSILNANIFIAHDFNVVSCQKFATFTSMAAFVIINVGANGVEDGITIAGTGWNVWRAENLGMTGTNATYIGIDMGVATANIIRFSGMLHSGVAGAIGFKGAANSANVTSGNLAKIFNSSFTGAITPLSGLTIDDTRWVFDFNDDIPDTMPDGLLSMTANATETVISVATTPVLVAGTWVIERVSLFTGTTAGRLTSDSERDIVQPIDITATIASASGVNKDISVYLARNGSIIANSVKTNRVGVTDPRNTTVMWQLSMSETDFDEVYVANDTDTINLIVSDIILRVR